MSRLATTFTVKSRLTHLFLNHLHEFRLLWAWPTPSKSFSGLSAYEYLIKHSDVISMLWAIYVTYTTHLWTGFDMGKTKEVHKQVLGTEVKPSVLVGDLLGDSDVGSIRWCRSVYSYSSLRASTSEWSCWILAEAPGNMWDYLAYTVGGSSLVRVLGELGQ